MRCDLHILVLVGVLRHNEIDLRDELIDIDDELEGALDRRVPLNHKFPVGFDREVEVLPGQDIFLVRQAPQLVGHPRVQLPVALLGQLLFVFLLLLLDDVVLQGVVLEQGADL